MRERTDGEVYENPLISEIFDTGCVNRELMGQKLSILRAARPNLLPLNFW